MTNTRFQHKRSTVSGVTPTTSDIAAGELGLNLADRRVFTSNGSAVFELGSNLTSLAVGNSTVRQIANTTGVFVNGGITLTRNDTTLGFTTTSGASVGMRQQSDDNFVFYTTNTTGGSRAVFNVFANTNAPNQNSAFRFNGPVDMGSSGFYANNSLGSSGQVLTSNGTSVYWSTVASSGGTVTNIATGSGLTGGPITNTGTVSVLANNGITANSTGLFVTQGTGAVVNSTGVHVNAAYIATIAANSASFAANLTGGNITGNYTVTESRDIRFTAAAQTDGNDGKIGAGLFASGLNIVGTQTSAGLGRQIRLYGTLIDSTGTEYVRNTGTWAITANNASFLGGTAAASYQLNSTLAANVATLTANNATFMNGNNVVTVMQSLRANRNLNGGGTITVDQFNFISWTARFIVIANGRGTHFGTSGYFDINCPTSGTITGVGGAANKTATAAGIPLGAWEALYYILPIGSGEGTVNANFRVAGYTSDLEIPSNWLLICVYNGDDGKVYFNNGIKLEPGQSYVGADHTSVRVGSNTFTIGTGSYFVANGNVGIGNTAPAHRLRVEGNFSLSGGVHANGSLGTSGQVLTSNGAGVYWAAAAGGITSITAGAGLSGGTITTSGTIAVIANTGVTANATGIHIGQAVGTSSSVQFGSLGVGTAASGTTGEIRATNNITAYFSDKRLKDIKGRIPDALEKLMSISGILYTGNEVAKSYGYDDDSQQVGVIAQEIEAVLPEAVKLAPFDTDFKDGEEYSRSGENYKTVQYEKLVPLLIEAIKEQQTMIQELKKIVDRINTQ